MKFNNIERILELLSLLKESNNEIDDLTDLRKSELDEKSFNHINNKTTDIREWLGEIGWVLSRELRDIEIDKQPN